ncbi:MAG: hypothetical protein QOJ22_102 [Thermoleophilaceae bacterium]|jgi:hypothetical protein|nr:hypothetical protein [Thermoleophilaceae bacterium]
MPRFVRSESDLPDKDFLMWVPREQAGAAACHIRYYVSGERHVVIAGYLDDGLTWAGSAESVARQLVATLVPPDEEFVFIEYEPQRPWTLRADFHEVTFETNGDAKRPSAAVLGTRAIPFPCFRELDRDAVEMLAGRPVLTFPLGAYTRALADASAAQPAARLFDLMVEQELCCPMHGLSSHGEYCGVDIRCYAELHRRSRKWRGPVRPKRRGCDGAYIGDRYGEWPRIELLLEGEYRQELPTFGSAAGGVAWGYGGSGAEEGATTILADYLGFLPRPELRGRFLQQVVKQLPRRGFALPVSELDAWYDRANPAWRRGLVVIAGPGDGGWTAGKGLGLAEAVGRELLARGFDVYEPGRNGELGGWKRNDHRLAGMVQASLLSALDASSMVVIPYDRDAVVLAAQSATALAYTARDAEVPVVVAHVGLEQQRLEQFRWLGYGLAGIDMHGPVPDVTRVIEAVDETRAAYERVRDERQYGRTL